jgi:hypothetical protein
MGQLISLSEHRVVMRRRLGMPAQIERESLASLRCTIVDITRTGACVLAPATALPGTFVLKVANATRLVCEVRWRKGYTVGVRFVSIDNLPARTAKATARVKRSCERATAIRPGAAEEAI